MFDSEGGRMVEDREGLLKIVEEKGCVGKIF
jgi:hypothetical protein